MSNRTQGYQYTMKDYLKIFIAFALLGGIIFFVLKATSVPMEATTETKVLDVLVAHDYTPTDRTELYIEKRPNMGIVKNITYINDPMWFEFFVFTDTDSAVGAYQTLSSDISSIEREYYNDCVETHGYRANFMYRALTAGGKYYHLMRIDNTILYAYSDEEDSSEIYSIAEELGYVW